jgi:antitoxin component of RelBE/YafQ-DinJ toxin-antitoxin module
MSGPRVSFRIPPDTKAVAAQIAAANGLTLASMVREFLYRYVATSSEPVRKLPTTRGARPVTLYVGAQLARAARLRAQRNNEDLSRPIVEFLTRTVEQWQAETAEKHPTSTAPQPTEIP